MKKINLIAYTMVVLMVGAMVGGAVNAWAAARAARVQLGDKQVGIYYESEKSIVLQAYEKLKFDGTERMGTQRMRIILK
jgi:hypothetical protein